MFVYEQRKVCTCSKNTYIIRLPWTWPKELQAAFVGNQCVITSQAEQVCMLCLRNPGRSTGEHGQGPFGSIPYFILKNNLWPLHIQKIFVTVNFLVSPPSVTIGAWPTGEAALPSSGSEPSYLAQSDPYSGTLRAVHSIRNAALGRTGDGTWLQLESLWRQKTFSSQMELSSTIYIEV